MSVIRVLIVDDDADIRDSLRTILETQSDMVVVAEADGGERSVLVARRIPCDVAIVDMNMPNGNGVEATAQLVALDNPPRVLMLTAFHHDESTMNALEAGATGFLLKGFRPGELPDAVRSVAAGRSVLASAAAETVIRRAVSAAKAIRAAQDVEDLFDVTDRERDLLRAIGNGLSNQQIADELFISPASVRTYVSRLLDKLGMTNRTQLAIAAHRAGLLG